MVEQKGQQEERHFNKTYVFISVLSALIMIYIIGITWVPIPKDNQRFADQSAIYLLGVLTTLVSYLAGGNPMLTKKSSSTQGSTTATFDATVTTEPKEPEFPKDKIG